jgi:hypothetical protein
MENRTPFDLNEAIRRWQESLGASPAFGADNLEELAPHLRASVQKLQADGLSEEEAFLSATRRLGERAALEREFAKINHAEMRMREVKQAVVIFGVCLTIAVFIFPFNGMPVASYFRSEDDAFIQLGGYINKGQSRTRVRWIYYRERASTMHLSAEKSDVWIVTGRERGEQARPLIDDPTRLIIHFAGDRVDEVRGELL